MALSDSSTDTKSEIIIDEIMKNSISSLDLKTMIVKADFWIDYQRESSQKDLFKVMILNEQRLANTIENYKNRSNDDWRLAWTLRERFRDTIFVLWESNDMDNLQKSLNEYYFSILENHKDLSNSDFKSLFDKIYYSNLWTPLWKDEIDRLWKLIHNRNPQAYIKHIYKLLEIDQNIEYKTGKIIKVLDDLDSFCKTFEHYEDCFTCLNLANTVKPLPKEIILKILELKNKYDDSIEKLIWETLLDIIGHDKLRKAIETIY